MVHFDKKAKRSMEVTMPDGTALQVIAPAKRLMGQIEAFWAHPEQVYAEEMYALAAEILSSNKTDTLFSPDSPEVEALTVDDVVELMREYTDFIFRIKKDPN